MHPLAWGAALLVPAMLMLKKKKDNQLLIAIDSQYVTPNGEITELLGTVADIIDEMEEVFPGSTVTISNDVIQVNGAKGNFYPNQLIPTPSGQVVIWKVNPLS